MGSGLSLLGNFGFGRVQSQLMDKIFEQFQNVKTFEDFHVKFLQACSEFNSAMLGVHYRIQKNINLLEHFNRWKDAKNTEEKNKILIELLNENIRVVPPDDFVVTIGVVAPPAAMVLKKTGVNLPAVKKFKLHMIPDFIFVPSVTLMAVLGAKLYRANANAKLYNQAASDTT